MGGLRDDLTVHERALDVLIELMKKEQLDESVPLHGIEKGISHFEVGRLANPIIFTGTPESSSTC